MKTLSFVFASAVVLALSGAGVSAAVANSYDVTTINGRPGYLTGHVGPDNSTWSKVMVVVAGCDTENTEHPLTDITTNPGWSAIRMSAITSTFGCASRLPCSNRPNFPRGFSSRGGRAGRSGSSWGGSHVQDSPMDKTTRHAHDGQIILCLLAVSLEPSASHWLNRERV